MGGFSQVVVVLRFFQRGQRAVIICRLATKRFMNVSLTLAAPLDMLVIVGWPEIAPVRA